MGDSVKRKASSNEQVANKRRVSASFSPEDNRTLVCAVRGLPGRVCTVTVSANASIHDLKKLIHQENAVQLADVDPTAFDVYFTKDTKHGWARVSGEGKMIGRGTPRAGAFMSPTHRVGDYFHADIPTFNSGIVHVVVDFVTQESMGPQVEEVGMTALADDKPTSSETDSDDYLDGEIERHSRVQNALGQFVTWSINGTDFSQKHDYQGEKWLEYDCYEHGQALRVYIGDKKTWRELYVACNQVVEMQEGRVGFRFVEDFSPSRGGSMIVLGIGT